MSVSAGLLRRSPHLVSYWVDGRLVFHNYAANTRVAASSTTSAILDFFDTWRPADALRAELPHVSPALLRKVVRALVSHSLLERFEDRRRRDPMAAWARWNPAAGLLHFSTKDTPFAGHPRRMQEFYRTRLQQKARPIASKRYRGARSVRLPSFSAHGELPGVLAARRTWRTFSNRPVSLEAVGTLLGLTFGIQRWIDLGVLGRAPLKTSPSHGACHPIEAYVLVRRVADLRAGLYHYAADRHRLEVLRYGASSRTIAGYLSGQGWFRTASLLVLMTAVFRRTEWQYPFPRAYRSILLDAGHLCQTFCLVATWLGLAPFCTAALADSRIEADLGLDGVTESVIYAAGVGHRPRGVEWAPWPDAARASRSTPVKVASRGRSRRG